MGHLESERCVQTFASLAGYPAELLFGKQEYGRSFGGASNLLLAVGCALGASRLCKVDDDCVNLSSGTESWLSNAAKLNPKGKEIRYGQYTSYQGSFLNALHEATRAGLVGHIYSQNEHAQRMDETRQGGVIKNGDLVFPSQAARQACFPVLYDPLTKIHIRGEIYCWKHLLEENGFSFRFDSALHLGHFPAKNRDINDWLRAIVYGYDLAFVDRVYCDSRRYPTLTERQKAISNFCAWLLAAVWPEFVNIDELLALLDTGLMYGFTDKILAESTIRSEAWQRLMRYDLRGVVLEMWPQLKERLSR